MTETELKPRARKAKNRKKKKLTVPPIPQGDDFWIVYRVTKGNPQPRFTNPTVKHASFDAANREAVRLAKLKPGLAFAVLKLEVTHHVKKESN